MDSAEDVAYGVASMSLAKESFPLAAPAIVVSMAALALIGTLLVISEKPLTETTITCTTNDSTGHYEDGWKKIEEVDFQRIGALVGKGKAGWSCKPGTLICTAIIEGRSHPGIIGCAWYWRKV